MRSLYLLESRLRCFYGRLASDRRSRCRYEQYVGTAAGKNGNHPSGDGKVNALDLLQMQKSILGQKSLNGSYSQAADVSGDGKVNALDLLQVQKNILGQKEL